MMEKINYKEDRIYELLLELIENPYEWSNFLKDFSEILNMDGTAFQKIKKESPKAEVFLQHKLCQKFVKNYEDLILKDFSILNYLRNLEENKIIDDINLFENFNNFTLINSLLNENNFYHIAIIGIFNNSKENIIFTSFRKKESGKFKDEEKKVLKKISCLLKFTYISCSKLEDMENYIELLKKTIEFEGKGIILLDNNLRITLLNKVAEEILSTKDGIEISKDGLEIMDPVISLQFKKSIKKILSSNNFCMEDYVFAVPKKDKKIPMIVQILPVLEKCNLNENSKKIIITIYDPKFKPLPNSSFLSQAFQFTNQENKIALLLSKGMDLKEIANELKISLLTVRTHLKHIYAKTNTSRQAELIKFLLELPKSI